MLPPVLCCLWTGLSCGDYISFPTSSISSKLPALEACILHNASGRGGRGAKKHLYNQEAPLAIRVKVACRAQTGYSFRVPTHSRSDPQNQHQWSLHRSLMQMQRQISTRSEPAQVAVDAVLAQPLETVVTPQLQRR